MAQFKVAWNPELKLLQLLFSSICYINILAATCQKCYTTILYGCVPWWWASEARNMWKLVCCNIVTLMNGCAFVGSNRNNCSNARKTIRPVEIWIPSCCIRFKTQMYQILYWCKCDTHACENLTFILQGIVEKNNCHCSSCTDPFTANLA
jgi:Ni,Fe-hydrogenase III small subunit